MADYVVWQLATDVEALAVELDQQPGDHDHAVAATIVAAVDGVLMAALLRPLAQRAGFVTDSLDLLLGSLVEGRPAT